MAGVIDVALVVVVFVYAFVRFVLRSLAPFLGTISVYCAQTTDPATGALTIGQFPFARTFVVDVV